VVLFNAIEKDSTILSKGIEGNQITKVSLGVITSMMIALCDLLPMVGLQVGMATSDAAGCNWVQYCNTLSTHMF
jgi:hypothetical protein